MFNFLVRVTRWVTHTHMCMDMRVNPYPPVYMGDLMGLFLCREYEYGVIIPDGYLPIVISIWDCLKKLVEHITRVVNLYTTFYFLFIIKIFLKLFKFIL
jgi:hypothetical protein